MFVQPGQRQFDRGVQLIVRAPNRRILSPTGEEVPESPFWMRRLRDGDVVLAEPAADQSPLDPGPRRLAATDAASAEAPPDETDAQARS